MRERHVLARADALRTWRTGSPGECGSVPQPAVELAERTCAPGVDVVDADEEVLLERLERAQGVVDRDGLDLDLGVQLPEADLEATGVLPLGHDGDLQPLGVAAAPEQVADLGYGARDVLVGVARVLLDDEALGIDPSLVEPAGHDEAGRLGLDVTWQEDPAGDSQVVVLAVLPQLERLLAAQDGAPRQPVQRLDELGRHVQDPNLPSSRFVRHQLLLG
jgi:hypothetical protein